MTLFWNTLCLCVLRPHLERLKNWSHSTVGAKLSEDSFSHEDGGRARRIPDQACNNLLGLSTSSHHSSHKVAGPLTQQLRAPSASVPGMQAKGDLADLASAGLETSTLHSTG